VVDKFFPEKGNLLIAIENFNINVGLTIEYSVKIGEIFTIISATRAKFKSPGVIFLLCHTTCQLMNFDYYTGSYLHVSGFQHHFKLMK